MSRFIFGNLIVANQATHNLAVDVCHSFLASADTECPRIVATRGPSASGKSTFATDLHMCGVQYSDLSRDRIRGLVFGDESIQGDQSVISKIQRLSIGEALRGGGNVMVCDTNTTADRLFAIRKVASTSPAYPLIFVVNFFTPFEECIARNARRSRVVPEHVIRRQFTELGANDGTGEFNTNLWKEI